MIDVNLDSFPDYLKERLARLATRDIAAVEVAMDAMPDGSRSLLIEGGHVVVDDEGAIRATERTSELLSAALAWYHVNVPQMSRAAAKSLEDELFSSPRAPRAANASSGIELDLPVAPPSDKTIPKPEPVGLSIDVDVLRRLVRESELLRGLQQSADRFRSRLVSHDTNVLKTVLASGEDGITLASLAHRTRLRPRSLVAVLGELRARRVIERKPAGVGRIQDAPFVIDTSSHCALGISLMKDRLVGVITGLRADDELVTDKRDIDLQSPRAAVAAIADLSSSLQQRVTAEESPRNIVGLGVELGGHVDASSGAVRIAVNLPWARHQKLDLKAELEQVTGLPTFVENDANALALYEQLCGIGRQGAHTFVVILVGDGIGAGIVDDDQLVRGSSGAAGEIGHLPVGDPALECNCGNYGCLEASAGVAAMVRSANDALDHGQATLTTLDAVVQIAADNSSIARIVEEAARSLGRGLACVLNMINPETLVLELPDRLTKSDVIASRYRLLVEETASRHAFSTTFSDCELRIRSAGDIATRRARGAAATALNGFVSDPLSDRFYRSELRERVRRELAHSLDTEFRDIAGTTITVSEAEAPEFGSGALDVVVRKVASRLPELVI
jgi:predicted NBD/HSP70 family sugar kinase